MSCGCRTGVTPFQNLHTSNEILIFFYCVSLNVHTSHEIWILWWLSGSKYDRILNISLLLPSSFNVPSWWFHEILNITLLLPLLFEWRFYGANSYSYEIVNISLVFKAFPILNIVAFSHICTYTYEPFKIIEKPIESFKNNRNLYKSYITVYIYIYICSICVYIYIYIYISYICQCTVPNMYAYIYIYIYIYICIIYHIYIWYNIYSPNSFWL